MKVLIDFKKVFTAFCKISETENKKIIIQPGQYLAEVKEEDESFFVHHQTFFFSIKRDDWIRGGFFIQNEISLRYLEKVESINQ